MNNKLFKYIKLTTIITAIIALCFFTNIVTIQGEIGSHRDAPDQNVPKFTGNIWYVDNARDDDTGDGETPRSAKKTIAAAYTIARAGDAIALKAGTYTENINIDLTGFEIRGEVGAMLAGTLTINQDSCRVRGLTISPTAEAGIVLNNNWCIIENVKINGTSTIAFDINGYHNCLYNCYATGYTVTAFDIASYNNHIHHCIAQGNRTSTRGFYLSNSVADKNAIECCISIGNGIAGYEIITGISDCTIKDCSSGGGDGIKVDADLANVWSHYTFDDHVHHVTTFAGGGPGADNIFKITGSVEIRHIFGNVTIILSADVDNIYLALYDGTNTVEITDSGGTDTDSADVGSFFVKTERAATAITLMKSDQCRIEENTNANRPRLPFIVNQKKDTDTFIQIIYSGVATSGVIHWHCKWFPLSENGFVEAI